MLKAIRADNFKKISVETNDGSFDRLIDQDLTILFPARKIRKVLLVAPPDGDASMFVYATAKRGRYWNYPSYGLGIIASYLRQDNIDVNIINLNNEILKACSYSSSKDSFDFDCIWKETLTQEIDKFKPDFIGMTCMFTQSHKSAALVCEEIKQLKPDIPLALGGVHITNSFMSRDVSDGILNDFHKVDLFFLFEAEIAFKYFIQAVNRAVSPSEIFQVCFNTTPNKFYFSKKNIPSDDTLDVIPAFDLMRVEDISKYGTIGSFSCLKEKKAICATVISNRGCRGKCTYCSVRNFNGPGVRCRSVQSVIDELLLLRDQFCIDHIMWLDDDLLYNHKRAIDLFNEMVKQHVGMTWDCTNGVIATSCKEELISAAAESGCIGINIGVESGNPEILKKIKKPGGVANFLDAAEVLKKFESINTRIFLMIGFPNETYRMILDTFNLAIKMDLDWYNITILQPLPNTPIFDLMVQQGLVDNTNASEVRYNSGPYGKKRERMIKDVFNSEFKNPFENKDLDEIPPKSQMEDIWLYMNFNLNFKRLFELNNAVKLDQQMKYVENITKVVAPDDPFPMYFYGYLQRKMTGVTDVKLITRLKRKLDSSTYWRNCFNVFNLSPSHLKNGNFPVDM